ncbi:MAG: sulfite exporter TauE/SafE family protein [Synergistaceae bacterium]|nr:sulfite exporter TauE/SafE family protein [Synergistaceae bacterium]
MSGLYEFLSFGRELSFSSWGLFALAVFIVGFSKTGLPGVTIVSVPLTAMIFSPKISVGLMLPIYMMGDVISVWSYWRFAQWRYCFPYLLFVGLGVWSASFVAELVDDKTFGVVIGWTVTVLILLSAATDRMQKWGQKWRQPARAEAQVRDEKILQETREAREAGKSPAPATSVFFGLVSGLVSALANAAAPIMAIYMIMARLSKFQILGTTAVCSFFMNWIKVPLFLSLNMLSVETLKLDIVSIPMVVVGGLAGILFAKKLPQKAFKNLVLVVALAASVKLILS